jgi:hypothetical protein
MIQHSFGKAKIILATSAEGDASPPKPVAVLSPSEVLQKVLIVTEPQQII